MENAVKIQLIKSRFELLRTLDFNSILLHFEETPSTRDCVKDDDNDDYKRVGRFLDQLEEDAEKEKKEEEEKEEAKEEREGGFEKFCRFLEIEYPQLLLLLLGWETRGSTTRQLENRKVVTASSPWSQLRFNKRHLTRVLDVHRLVPSMFLERIISLREAREIVQRETNEKRMDILIDILEGKPHHLSDAFLETISAQHPHLYLKMTERGSE